MVTVAGHDLHLELPMRIALLAAASVLTLAACGTTPSSSSPPSTATPDVPTTSTAKQAVAVLASASGSLVSGSVTLTPMGKGLHLTGEIGGLPANSTHAFHVHEKGDCSAADASSAGPHFNPFNTAHGKAGSGPHHAGDMNNLTANADGVAKVDAHVEGVTLGGGAVNDVATRALIVHAAPDDYASQPAGNAGARVACGIIKITR
jgi:Cu-Zn family superoxide dismutase